MLRALSILAAAIAASLVAISPSFAQKQLNVVIPYGPGGNFDVVARQLGELVKPYLEDNWIVLNKPGGGGNNAINDFLRIKPDGQTIALIPGTAFLQPYVRDVKWTGPDDFVPIAIVANSPNIYYVKTDARWKDLAALLADAKSQPEKISVGVPTLFGTHAIVDAVMKSKGIKFLGVPFNGDAPVVQAVLGGHIDSGVGAVGSTGAHLEAKSIRGVAVSSRARLPRFPDIPTFTELGYPIAIENFVIAVAPKGTPPERIEALRAAIQKATARPEYKEFAERSGILPETAFGADLNKQIAEMYATFKQYAPDVQYLKDR
jgi:tripartite-type tricarboxylate transporter receptor subunit TctC